MCVPVPGGEALVDWAFRITHFADYRRLLIDEVESFRMEREQERVIDLTSTSGCSDDDTTAGGATRCSPSSRSTESCNGSVGSISIAENRRAHTAEELPLPGFYSAAAEGAAFVCSATLAALGVCGDSHPVHSNSTGANIARRTSDGIPAR